MKAKPLIVVAVLMIATLGVMLVARARVAQKPRPAESMLAASASGSLDPLWPAPTFSYPDEQGKIVDNASLKGKVWVANFIFTQCRTVCPLLTTKMAMLMRKLPGIDARFISFSVDPKNDSQMALAHYKQVWASNESRWSLLSTDTATLPQLAQGFHVSAEKNKEDGGDPITHSSVFVVVDAIGLVRGVFDSEHAEDFAALEQAVRVLAAPPREQQQAKAGVEPAQLYQDLKCAQCHDQPALAPSLGGRAGKRRELDNGLLVDYDEAYVRESLLSPDAKRVRGYPLHMPSYAGHLDAAALKAMTTWLLTLPAAPSVDGGHEATAHLETDVVCGMTVRVVHDTPKTVYQGREHYFCAPQCKDEFLARPAAFTQKKF